MPSPSLNINAHESSLITAIVEQLGGDARKVASFTPSDPLKYLSALSDDTSIAVSDLGQVAIEAIVTHERVGSLTAVVSMLGTPQGGKYAVQKVVLAIIIKEGLGVGIWCPYADTR